MATPLIPYTLSNIQTIFYIVSYRSALDHIDDQMEALRSELRMMRSDHVTKLTRHARLQTSYQQMDRELARIEYEKQYRQENKAWTVCNGCDESTEDNFGYERGSDEEEWYEFPCDLCKKESRRPSDPSKWM